MKKKLARKRFRIKNDHGKYIGEISAISLVSQPAIEKDFQLFNEEEIKKVNFQVSSEEKMEITGIAMSPDQDIIRKDKETGEYYYCYFTKQDILDYRDYFMKYGNTKKANFEHSDDYMKDFFITESWVVVDAKCDKLSALGFKDCKEGDWAVTFKCTSSKLWEELKNSSLKGFSVEIALEEFTEEAIKDIVYNDELSEEEKLTRIKHLIYK